MMKLGKVFGVISGLLIGIWMVGAVIIALNIEYQRKSDCIRDEGFVTGWLWCNTDDTSRFMGMQFTKNIFIALKWPIDVFSKTEPLYRTAEFNEPYSPVAHMFVCSFVGTVSGLKPDASETLVNFFLAGNISNEQINDWIEDSRKLIEVEYMDQVFYSDQSIREFWKNACDAPWSEFEALM